MKPRVFVVMPFGTKTLDAGGDAARPDVKVDFTCVYKALLAPAIERAGCEPFRADEEQSSGDIRTDMFFELVTADFVLADVSVFNPNVFYELGVRHGITPRGTILVSGGWSRVPFDIAPDRRFLYEGRLFEVVKDGRAEPAAGALHDEVRRLAKNLERIIASDREKTASPVFAALPGLTAGDWSAVENAQARYFNVVIDEMMRRVQTARAEGLPGDIMTLAEKAPTRFHEGRLLLEAARGLMDLRRFALAREKLDELLRLDPDNLQAKLRLALVLNRLGHGHEAELMLREISAQAPKDMDVLNTLGRVYKDLWRRQWEDMPDLEQRQRAALRGYALASRAANYFSAAFFGNLNAHQSGINALGMIALCDQIGRIGGEELTVVRQANAGIAEAVQLAAHAVLSRGNEGGLRPVDEVWAYATRGEREILRGDGRRARHEYRKAIGLTDCTLFMIETMLSQLKLYDLLGVHQDVLAPVLEDLEYQVAQRQLKLKRYEKVVVFSGHRTDEPGRTQARFPERKVRAVAAEIRARLDAWGIGPDKPVLAICGGARGGDILFAEQCRDLHADLRLLVPLPEGDFLDHSVRSDAGHWVERYFGLKRDPCCRVFFEHEQLGRPADEHDRPRLYDRSNRWRLNSARAEVDADDLYVLTLYDVTQQAGGADGTREFVEQARRHASHYENINPRDIGE
jgi:tetratricopeptide (TPR) repeat protein